MAQAVGFGSHGRSSSPGRAASGSFTGFGIQPGPSVIGAEDRVNQDVGVGMGYGRTPLRPDIAPDGAGVFARTFSHGLGRGLQDIARFAGSEPRIHTKLPNAFLWKCRNSRAQTLEVCARPPAGEGG